ncbi:MULTISPECIES: hypothetical protein [unclassified Carboxylicivirga]|uniref:hypothetical protein n=1 Tax=Carboxylicivirga TaxID=1628153 RepID=UPI003D32E72F
MINYHPIDCVAFMKELPDQYYDLAVVDPPYFSEPEKRMFYGKKKSSINVKRKNYEEMETWEVPGKEYFRELFRVSKRQIIWGCNYFEWDFTPGRIIWDKVNGNSSFSDCEIAFCSMHESVRLFRFMWNGMLQGKSIKEGHLQQGNKRLNEFRIHPTQKPVKLYLWTFQTYAENGWKILDTHRGSGSSGVAILELNKKLGMNLTLDSCEKDISMHRKSSEWLVREQAKYELNPVLFE